MMASSLLLSIFVVERDGKVFLHLKFFWYLGVEKIALAEAPLSPALLGQVVFSGKNNMQHWDSNLCPPSFPNKCYVTIHYVKDVSSKQNCQHACSICMKTSTVSKCHIRENDLKESKTISYFVSSILLYLLGTSLQKIVSSAMQSKEST